MRSCRVVAAATVLLMAATAGDSGAAPKAELRGAKRATAQKNRVVRRQLHRLLSLGREGHRSLSNRSTGQLVLLDKGVGLRLGDRLMLSADKWTRGASILFRSEDLGQGVILTSRVFPRRSLGYWLRTLTGRGRYTLALTRDKDRRFLKHMFPELSDPARVKTMVDQAAKELAKGLE